MDMGDIVLLLWKLGVTGVMMHISPVFPPQLLAGATFCAMCASLSLSLSLPACEPVPQTR